jgi:hypothetical protein
MSHESISQKIAAKCYFTELSAARALGYDGVTSYERAFRCLDAVYAAAFEAERPLVLTRFRPLERRA